jgi:hypothetical protein
MTTRPTTAAEFLALDYRVSISETGGRFHLHVPQLGLIVDDADLATAWANLSAAKRDYFKRHAAIGRLDAIPLPAGDAPRALALAVAPFAAKVGIAALAVVCLLLAGIAGFDHVVRSLPGRLLHQFTEVSTSAKVMSRQISPERLDQAKSELRTMVEMIKPFADELRPLFADPACGPAQPRQTSR